MSWEETILLLPCQSLEDLHLEREAVDAEELLGGWSGLYHPAIIACARNVLRWQRAYDPPQNLTGRLVVVPRCCEALVPPEWLAEAESAGVSLVRAFGTRARLLELLLPRLDNPGDQLDPDVVADFLALGFCHLGVELLTRQLRYMSNLDESRFRTETVAAAEEAMAGQPSRAREHLRTAFELLSQAASYFYPVETYLLDLTLVADSTLGAPLRAELASGAPINVLIPGRLVEAMAAQEPQSLCALRGALQDGTAALVGGEYEETELPLLGVEAIRARMLRGLEAYERHLGVRPGLFGRRRFGLSPLLPQILVGLGFHGALHFTLDDGQFPAGTQSKIRWEDTASVAVDALARVPMDASRAESFLRLAVHLGRMMDLDHAATGVLAHWPGRSSPWYADLRRVSRYASVLGRFLTLTEYFQNTSYVGQTTRYRADEYRSPYLEQAVAADQPDPISRWVRYHRRRALADALGSVATMADLAAGTSFSGDTVVRLLEEVEGLAGSSGAKQGQDAYSTAADQPELDGRLARALDAAVDRLVRSLPAAGTAAQQGLLLVNPLSFARRTYADVSALAAAPPVEGPVRWVGEDAGCQVAAVEIPAMGFAWLAPGVGPPPAPAPSARPGRKARRAAAPPMVEPEKHLLRNEFFEVEISPKTGAIQGVFGLRRPANRLAQQVALRMVRGRAADPAELAPDDPERDYSTMVAEEVAVTSAGPVVGRIVSRGRLVDPEGVRVAGFCQATTVRRGSRVIELDIELDVARAPEARPWASYYAARFAWNDEMAELYRGLGLTTRPTAGGRLESPYFVEIRSEHQRITILSGGLPFHRQVGLRKLDTLLVVRGETARRFRLGIGIDLAYPAPAAWDFLCPHLLCAATRPAPAAPWGWLFHVENRNVVATAWEPLTEGGQVVGFRVRLLETEGRPCQVGLRSFRTLGTARRVNLLGQSPSELAVQGDRLTIPIQGHQWVQVEAHFSGQESRQTEALE